MLLQMVAHFYKKTCFTIFCMISKLHPADSLNRINEQNRNMAYCN